MPKNCFVPGCKTTFIKRCDRKPGEKHLTFFSAPKDPMLRKQWHIASRRGDREMNLRDVICELHFSEDCIQRYFTTELYEGETFKLERDRPALKKGAIPTIFPFSDSTLLHSKRGRRRKPVEAKKRQLLVCSAYSCTNRSDKKIPGISFHRFPLDKLQRTWMAAARQSDWMPSKGSILCSEHFTPDQFEHMGSSTRLKFCAIPTLFPGRKNQMSRPANLQTDDSDSSDMEQDSDDDALSQISMDFLVQKKNNEIPEETSASDEDTPSTSQNFIFKGHEDTFGKFVANELKTLSCDPYLHLRTMKKIWRVLEDASQMLK